VNPDSVAASPVPAAIGSVIADMPGITDGPGVDVTVEGSAR
jgi:hypothetical protein